MTTTHTETVPPEFAGDEGWRHVDMPRQFGEGRSFVSGDPAGERIRIYYFVRDADHTFCAKVWFGLDAEGPPGHAHGGASAAVLDEAMGFACWAFGYPVVAGTITIQFLKQVPLGRVLNVEAVLDQVDEQKVFTRGRIVEAESGRQFVTGEGLFVRRTMEHFGEGLKPIHRAKDRVRQRELPPSSA